MTAFSLRPYVGRHRAPNTLPRPVRVHPARSHARCFEWVVDPGYGGPADRARVRCKRNRNHVLVDGTGHDFGHCVQVAA